MVCFSLPPLQGNGDLRNELLKIFQSVIIMLIKLIFKGEPLWLRVLSVNDERETVVGRVWNHPFNRALITDRRYRFRLTLYMIHVIYSFNVR